RPQRDGAKGVGLRIPPRRAAAFLRGRYRGGAAATGPDRGCVFCRWGLRARRPRWARGAAFQNKRAERLGRAGAAGRRIAPRRPPSLEKAAERFSFSFIQHSDQRTPFEKRPS
ncbi:unnamed protein product, partial [Amoebophrya sp. A120]